MAALSAISAPPAIPRPDRSRGKSPDTHIATPQHTRATPVGPNSISFSTSWTELVAPTGTPTDAARIATHLSLRTTLLWFAPGGRTAAENGAKRRNRL
jgi:hypothetical protein